MRHRRTSELLCPQCCRRESNPRRTRGENPVAPGHQSNDSSAARSGLEPEVSALRTRRDSHYPNEPWCIAQESNPDSPVRSRVRYPLHQRCVPLRGLEPLQSGLKVRCPSSRARAASAGSWPPRNRTARYLFIRQDPSTTWVVASGCGRSRTCKAVRLARVQTGFRRRSDCASLRKGRDSNPEGSSRCSTVFETAAVASRLALPWRMAQELNLLRTRAPTARFQRGALPVGQPSGSGERSNRSPHPKGAHSLAARPGALTGSLSLRTEPRIRTGNLPALNGAPLPDWASPA